MTDQDRLVEDFILLASGFVAVKAQGEVMHVQCMTDPQRRDISRFFKASSATVQNFECDICEKPLSEAPDA